LVAFLLVVVCSAQTFVGPVWQHQTASTKLNILNAIVRNNTTPGTFPNPLQLAELFIEDMNLSFSTEGDDMPEQLLQRRPKLIHSVGVVADAVWKVVPNSLGYTGIFESGCSKMYVRLSCAHDPTGPGGYAPGLSIKVLRDEVPSGNMFAMFSLQGQGSNWNFFAHDLTNHVPDLSANANIVLKELRNTFAKASQWPVMIGVSNLAQYDASGKNYTSPKFPFRLVFHPTTALHKAFPTTPQQPFTDVLQKGLATPADMYYVYAVVNPNDPIDKFVHIGTISTVSPATTTNFGDVYMFFEHTRMEADFIHRPDWAAPATQIMANQRAVDNYVYPDLPFN